MNNNKIQTLANDFLEECNIKDLFVKDAEGNKIMVIHLLTDFCRFIEKNEK